MMKAFFKEYRFWYLIYGLQASFFALTFFLYRLPLTYFTYSFLVSSVVILLVSLALLYRFSQKMRLLNDFTFQVDTYLLTKPSDQAYLKRIETEKEKVAQALHDSKEREAQLQYIIKLWAHQLKVPLSAISLMLQTDHLSKSDLTLQTQSINHYLSNLLNYMTLTSQANDYLFETIMVRELIVKLVKEFRIQFLKKNIRLVLEGDWQLVSDRKWLTFALSQLLDNALKYSKTDGLITITMSEHGISISDQGIGILPEDLPRLFEQGFTGFNGREHQKATGFGLYMTKQILDHMELAISIISQLDKGTTVHIYHDTQPTVLTSKQ